MKEIKEIQIIGRIHTLDIIARLYFGISMISLSPDEALLLREEIDEWLEEATTKNDHIVESLV
jgi:hypothetical protein